MRSGVFMGVLVACVAWGLSVGCTPNAQPHSLPVTVARNVAQPKSSNKVTLPPVSSPEVPLHVEPPKPLSAPKPPVVLTQLVPVNSKAVGFPGGCVEGDQLVIGASGDILIHGRLQRQAMKHALRFRSLWSGVEDLFAAADMMYLNLEGPAARGVKLGGGYTTDPGFRFDDEVYTSYPQFNYHPHLIEDLCASGVDVVSTANNHSLDRGWRGIDRTIEALNAQNMPYTGTRLAAFKKSTTPPPRHVVVEKKGFRVAWLSCTFSVNGLPDYKDQVLRCYEDRKELLSTITALSKDDTLDAVMVTPHWGLEYTTAIRKKERVLAVDILEAGATAVLGAHPHVLQPWLTHTTRDGRRGLIVYSLGNFISNMSEPARRASAIVYVGLTRDKVSRKVIINGVRYVPTYMYRGKVRTLKAIERGGLSNATSKKGLAFILKVWGNYNLERLSKLPGLITTNPQCDPSWRAPLEFHAHNGGIGGACRVDSDCPEGGTCLTSSAYPQGFCAQSCEDAACPRQARRRARLVCVAQEQGATCLPRCGSKSPCRDGYTCSAQPLNSKGKRAVCVPSAS